MTLMALLRRELAGYFWSPLGWLVMTLFLLVQGYAFYLFVQLIAQPHAPHGAVMRLFFGGTLLYWLFVIVVVSVITMRLVAEERHSGTLEALLSAPVRDVTIVGAKYLAAIAFYAVLWAPTALYVLLVWQLQSDPPLDAGPVLSGYLGTLIVGAACLAVGLLCSVLARSQLVAALLTFSVLTLHLLLEPLAQFVRGARVKALIEYVSLFRHMDDFARGIVDSRALVLLLSVVVFCLVAATFALRRRWS